MTTLEPKYTLFDSLEQMLAPDTLSELLSRPVTRVDVQPMEHGGIAGSQLSFVDTDAGRLVLKTMFMDRDWIMFASHDHQFRAVTLWQYGILDQIQPFADHKIIACAREGTGWVIMMEDVSGNLFSWENKPLPAELVPTLLDTLARQHATFWNRNELKDPRLGLCDSKAFLDSLALPPAQKHTGEAMGVIPEWLRAGWEVMEDLLSAEVFTQMHNLIQTPAPLLNATARYPFTLLHGDFRLGNLAYTDRFIPLDWQIAACSLMTAELSWLTLDLRHVLDRESVISIYRQRLETHLNQRFENSEWQAMTALGDAFNALRSAFIFAYWFREDENPDNRAMNEKIVHQQGQRVMDALRWL